MSNALRTKILAAKPAKLEPVEVPEWGGVTVYVRELTVGQRDAFEDGLVDRKGGTVTLRTIGLKSSLLVQTLCDEDGNRIFEDGDEKLVSELGAAGVERVFAVAQRVNKMRKDDETDPKE